jgi:hypothetical protein
LEIKENRQRSWRLYILIGRQQAKRSFPFMPNHIFISYASRDQNRAEEICLHLESSGIRCWITPRDIRPGSSWGDEIIAALRSSAAVLVVLSPESNRSAHVAREVSVAIEHRLIVLPVLIERFEISGEMEILIGNLQSIILYGDGRPTGLDRIAHTLAILAPQAEQSEPPVHQRSQESDTKGYVFISYDRHSSDFVLRLKDILKRRKYAYWDYKESERDYHNALYKELEEKIENAQAFMSVVTDSWRESEWPAAEYIYAKEAKVPVFVIQAVRLARPFPIIINQQTRIDMASDFEIGASVLEHELDKKGL